jgi:hypothetical protein
MRAGGQVAMTIWSFLKKREVLSGGYINSVLPFLGKFRLSFLTPACPVGYTWTRLRGLLLVQANSCDAWGTA